MRPEVIAVSQKASDSTAPGRGGSTGGLALVREGSAVAQDWLNPEAEWARSLRDPRLGELTLLEVGRTVAGHEVGHLTQLRNLIALVPEPTDLGEVRVAGAGLRPSAAPEPAPSEVNGAEPQDS